MSCNFEEFGRRVDSITTNDEVVLSASKRTIILIPEMDKISSCRIYRSSIYRPGISAKLLRRQENEGRN